MFDKHVTVAATNASSSSSSSSKRSKIKLNEMTESIVKANIQVFERNSIEDSASRNQRSRVFNKSRVPQHISQPTVARLSKNDDNVSPTAYIYLSF